MALSYKTKLPLAFRERHIKAFLSAASTFHKKLQCKCCLSGARLPLNQVQPLSVKSPAQDIVQPGNPSRQAFAAL